MRMKYRGEVGIDMKRTILSTLAVSRRNVTAAMSIFNAVRFTLAQLFFGFFGFMPKPI